MVFEVGTVFDVWMSFEQQLLLVTIEKEGNLKNMLMGIKKGSHWIEE